MHFGSNIFNSHSVWLKYWQKADIHTTGNTIEWDCSRIYQKHHWNCRRHQCIWYDIVSGPSQEFSWVGHGDRDYAPLDIPNVFKAAGIDTHWDPETNKIFETGRHQKINFKNSFIFSVLGLLYPVSPGRVSLMGEPGGRFRNIRK